MGTIRAALFLIGTTVGAGFLTGAELVRFFGGAGYLFALAAACGMQFACGVLFLSLGKKYGGCNGAMRALFGRSGKAIYIMLLAVTFFPCAGMLAGLDALISNYAPFPSIIGLAVVVFFLCRGLRGVGALNTALVPFLIALVLLTGIGKVAAPLQMPALSEGGNAVLYAGMNTAFAAPVLMDTGREVRAPVRACAFASVCIFLCGACILGGIFAMGDAALVSPMPYLVVIRGRRVFAVAVGCSVLTSLSSALYPLFTACERLGAQKNAARGVVLLAAFILSRVGLARVIDLFYPIAGAIGIVFSVVCVLDEYLFQQYHKGVHARRKQTENKGRAHDKVQLKHLTAVDDEVSQSRPRDNVLAHDGPDPRHSHIDFEHGDDGRIGGRDDKFP